jgi:hypothetical protein
MLNDELERMWKKVDVNCHEHMLEGTDENTEIAGRVVGLWTEM